MDIYYPDVVPKFPKKDSYSLPELLAFANREFGDDLPPLPLPPLLMLHRIINIGETGGAYNKGFAAAEYDVNPEDWYFKCHFKGNPIMPGALGFDGIMQLGGFFFAWTGARGGGMATSFGGGKFRGKILPTSRVVRFEVHIKHVKPKSNVPLVKFDGHVFCDHKQVYEMEDFTVGILPAAKS